MGTLLVEALSKNYGEKRALNNFCMKINAGEIVGLVGRNGAGKTTLLNCIAGNIFPDSGTISFDGTDILKEGKERKNFGILIEPSFLEYMNTYDNLKLLQNAVGVWDKQLIKKRTDEVLKIVGLENKGKSYVKSFSFGMKQRLGFAQALLNGNNFLILDEPFVGLDINGRKMVKEYIRKIVKEKQIGVIFSDHNLDEVRDLCDRVIVIKDGCKIYDDGLEEEIAYEIRVESISEELTKAMDPVADILIDSEKNSIYFEGNYDIHEIISIIIRYARILSIRTSENKLESMIKEESS